MTAKPGEPPVEPDPAQFTTKRDVKVALSLLRQRAGLTIRGVVEKTGLRHGRVAGHFGGAHLPSRADLAIYLRLFGITDQAVVERWCSEVDRFRRGSDSPGRSASAGLTPAEAIRDTLVSTRPPEYRLDVPIRGRDALIDQLTGERGGAGVLVLHGLGGVGKSTLALALARRARDAGTPTWWISAADTASFTAGVRALAVELGVDPAALRAGSPPDLLWARLAVLPPPFVLVIDDADDPPGQLAIRESRVIDGNGWLRPVPDGHCRLVVTTRDGSRQTWGEPPPPWLRLVKVDGLNPPDGGALLRDLAGEPAGSEAEAAVLAERLGGLPLGLSLAGRYLAESARIPDQFADSGSPRTFTAYAATLRHGRQPAPDAGPSVDRPARELIGSTWELSLDLLAARGTAVARPLLRLLSCFESAGIPYRLLDPKTMARSVLFSGIDGRGLWRALQALVGLGLVDTQQPAAGADHQLTMHPLVRATSRHHRDVRTQLGDYLGLVTELVNHAAANLDPSSPASWPAWRGLADQCESPLKLVSDQHAPPTNAPIAVVTAAIRAARYLRASGQLARAEAALGRAMKVGRRLLADHHPNLLALRHEAARVWYGLGRLHDAYRSFDTVHTARTQILGGEHPDTLTTAHYLARTQRDLGKVAKAAQLFRSTLDARRRTLGDEHPATLTSRNNLADLLRALGEFDLAGRELAKVYGSRRRLLGPEHPATLVTAYHLARLAHNRGDLPGTEDKLDSLHATCRQVLGEHHPRTLTVVQSLVEVYHDQGRLEEAEHLAQAVLAARSASLGAHHPATLQSRHRLALLLRDRGDVDIAEAELQRVLDTRRQVLDNGHPDTVQARRDLDALRRQGKAGGAR